ncbi:DUF6303 family protein [Streptomyces sp. NPDC002409]
MRPHARMATGVEGTWVLYVLLPDVPMLEWPKHEFGRVLPVPTLEERAAALAGLGYAALDGAGWEWRETPPHIFASTQVRTMTPTGRDTAGPLATGAV